MTNQSSETSAPILAPEVGQAVRVRNRLATVLSVQPYDSHDEEGRLNLVEVEYLDDCRHPENDLLLWEAETTASVLGTTSLPRVDQFSPDSPSSLHSFVNSNRWTRLNRLRPNREIENEPILGIWNSAIQVHPYQLEPVLAALRMPRVSLLLADGVGLGKTIQSGLVLEELLLRRRIRRVLVISPAMLQRQWKYELRRKFNLDFEIIDSDSTFQLRRRLGIDTNPWKAFPRVITSMDYLRLPDILQQFLQASGEGRDQTPSNGHESPHASWDLLIVDEAHNFAPQGGNRASQRTRMLREIRFLFEHRIFLTATPHNGKTVCFTGLLELLDPVRFQMSVEMRDRDHQNLNEIRIRRLKPDINKHSLRPPFAEELPPRELPVHLEDKEQALFKALRQYRDKGQAVFEEHYNPTERWVSSFIFSLLTKRLLSCPYSFARTWWRHLGDGETEEETQKLFDLAKASSEKVDEGIKSDDEKSLAEEDAARHGGSWMRNKEEAIRNLQASVTTALENYGFGRKLIEDENNVQQAARILDSKTAELVKWVKENLFDSSGHLRDDERLIIFTEYKETLEYIDQIFRDEGFDDNTMRHLYGGMTAREFESVQHEFEDPNAEVRLLLATDAASEGINMQECCRWIIHYDIPWSPSKILQRNGRVSRHGQIRDVQVHYFRCDQVEDSEFLAKIAKKVQQVEEDLGSVERVFDIALQDHLKGRKTTDEELDRKIAHQREKDLTRKDLGLTTGDQIESSAQRAQELLESTQDRLGISPESLIRILRSAIEIEGQGSLDEIDGRPGFFRLHPPPRWENLVQETMTVGSRQDRMELVFDNAHVEEEVSGRRRLRLKKHQVLMRLGHPVMRQAMSTLSRQLHDPSGNSPIRRWSISAIHRTGFDALLVFHYTLTAINQLREPLHDEVQTKVFRIDGNRLIEVENQFADSVLHEEFLRLGSSDRLEEWTRTIRSKWSSYQSELERIMADLEENTLRDYEAIAKTALANERKTVDQGYRHRLKELSERSREKELRKVVEALLDEQVEAMQATLFPELKEDAEKRRADLEHQVNILKRDVEMTRERIERERKNRKEVVLPRRFTIEHFRALPLAVEFVVPAVAEDLKR